MKFTTLAALGLLANVDAIDYDGDGTDDYEVPAEDTCEGNDCVPEDDW
jgi:hypothetical protein